MIFVQILPACGLHTYQIQTSNVDICYGGTEKIQLQIYCKNSFSDRTFYVTITNDEIGSLKFLHKLFD